MTTGRVGVQLSTFHFTAGDVQFLGEQLQSGVQTASEVLFQSLGEFGSGQCSETCTQGYPYLM